MAAKKRTTLRSRSGSKLYSERNRKGEFEDVQTFKRAHGQDVKRVSKAETAARAAAGKPARKKSVKKKTARKSVKKSASPRKAATARKRTTTRKSAAKKK